MDEHEHEHELADWGARVDHLEREGVELLDVVTTAAVWAGELLGPVRRIIDVGSGPGVGTCELARCFPDAEVVAVDASAPMLQRVVERAASLGFAARISTRLSDLSPGVDGLDGLASADLVFASMSLHHLADPAGVLASIRRVVGAAGLVVVIEHGPDGPHGHAPTIDPPALLRGAGFDVVGSRVSSGRTIVLGRPAAPSADA